MRIIIAATLLGALLVPAGAAPIGDSPGARPGERGIMLALNPQPEPPGRAKIKRIYSGKDDSRRNKDLHPVKQKPVNQAPATKY
jgi:hypothetical protein